MNKIVLILFGLLGILAVTSACDSLPLAALNSATNTPTRTPRPTFTPRAQATETLTATQVPQGTEAATTVPDTPEDQPTETDTPKAAAKNTRPPAPPQPTAIPQPTTPSFPVHPDFGQAKFCPQDGIYEIIVYVKNDGAAGERKFSVGLYYAVFSGGQLLKDGAGHDLIGPPTDKKGTESKGANCNAAYDPLHPTLSNGKLDVGDVVRRGTTQMAFHFIRSPTDLTALSADVPLDFSQAGRWWLAFGYAGG